MNGDVGEVADRKSESCQLLKRWQKVITNLNWSNESDELHRLPGNVEWLNIKVIRFFINELCSTMSNQHNMLRRPLNLKKCVWCTSNAFHRNVSVKYFREQAKQLLRRVHPFRRALFIFLLIRTRQFEADHLKRLIVHFQYAGVPDSLDTLCSIDCLVNDVYPTLFIGDYDGTSDSEVLNQEGRC